jgi:hypothetical protein
MCVGVYTGYIVAEHDWNMNLDYIAINNIVNIILGV